MRARFFASLALLGIAAAQAATAFAPVLAGKPLSFPADYGSHPEFRTEWWYVTGWLNTAQGESLGFQVTFFRTKPDLATDNPSSFTPHQILIAHCALSDPKHGRLLQDQRVRRAGLGLAQAAAGDTAVAIERWSLVREADQYVAHIDAEDFALDLRLTPTQAVLLNGDAGVSRKGPHATSASYYYSVPHLSVAGLVTRTGKPAQVTGEAWLDHEWSSEYLSADAEGWDWLGLNLDDGSALMAFRIRDADGKTYWAGGTLRGRDGRVQVFEPSDIELDPRSRWTSPRTAIVYPVQWALHAGGRTLDLMPLMADQENDTRLSTGAIYWEGAVRASENGAPVGRGYLELTGYGGKLRLP